MSYRVSFFVPFFSLADRYSATPEGKIALTQLLPGAIIIVALARRRIIFLNFLASPEKKKISVSSPPAQYHLQPTRPNAPDPLNI